MPASMDAGIFFVIDARHKVRCYRRFSQKPCKPLLTRRVSNGRVIALLNVVLLIKYLKYKINFYIAGLFNPSAIACLYFGCS